MTTTEDVPAGWPYLWTPTEVAVARRRRREESATLLEPRQHVPGGPHHARPRSLSAYTLRSWFPLSLSLGFDVGRVFTHLVPGRATAEAMSSARAGRKGTEVDVAASHGA